MGTVYRAVDTRLNRTVAVKVWRPGEGKAEGSSQRMLKEASDRLAQQDQWIKARREHINASLARLDQDFDKLLTICLLYTSPSPRDGLLSRMPSSA